ncbi:alcohol dehydrogenase-like protein 4 isoform X1 [Cinnamomum micranthum f. kanehirae]|uniref:Alcohol dehydrogenase-like protein 4 isoform X1 n=1 Tax=Cinnamomum micranthum f. kanehirae TaxID=337451 RepID=A0A443PFM6_9MAGN|nr:alcohol dehydrogenase-like protein 4 isoform X1 [Cinnamomum micranthum f. kanehirae]
MGSLIEESDDGLHANGFIPSNTAGKVITCRAAVAWGPKEPIVIEEVLVDPPQKMEVRIKVVFTSICHTDLSGWMGENETQRVFPRILGHDAAGIVESVGEGVQDIIPGDQVVPIFNGECGNCSNCKSNKTNLCNKFRVDPFKSVMVSDGKTRFSTRDGKPIYHFLNTSTFTEYTVLDSACVVKMTPNSPLKKMSLLSCGLSTGVELHGTLQTCSRVRPRQYSEILEMTGGGVDYSFECAGNMEVLREAFLCTHDGWGLTVILGTHPSPRMLPFHPMELFNGRRLVGCVFGDFKGKTQLPDFADKCIHGGLNLDGFITHELPFSEINEGFQLLIDGKSFKMSLASLMWAETIQLLSLPCISLGKCTV